MLAGVKKSGFRFTGKQGGFTLIELMIVVSIMGILAALSLPAYHIWIENTRIRNAAESIQTGLQKARVAALRNNASVQFVLAANSGWTIGCLNVTAECPALIEQRGATEGSSANTAVTITPAASTTLVFTNLGTVMPSPPAVTAPFTQVDIDSATLSATDSRELRVTIGAGGIGHMCDPSPLLEATDPRKCPPP